MGSMDLSINKKSQISLLHIYFFSFQSSSVPIGKPFSSPGIPKTKFSYQNPPFKTPIQSNDNKPITSHLVSLELHLAQIRSLNFVAPHLPQIASNSLQ